MMHSKRPVNPSWTWRRSRQDMMTTRLKGYADFT